MTFICECLPNWVNAWQNLGYWLTNLGWWAACAAASVAGAWNALLIGGEGRKEEGALFQPDVVETYIQITEEQITARRTRLERLLQGVCPPCDALQGVQELSQKMFMTTSHSKIPFTQTSYYLLILPSKSYTSSSHPTPQLVLLATYVLSTNLCLTFCYCWYGRSLSDRSKRLSFST